MNPLWLTAVLLVALLIVAWLNGRRWARRLATIRAVTLGPVGSAHLEGERPIHVFLPPGYDDEDERYPVLYVNDGGEMAALGMRETLARLIGRGRIRPIIVVAIPTNKDRLLEYGTAVAPNAQGLGTKAGEYARFVTEELMPLIDRQLRTRTGAANTAVLGASLGGLSAFDLAWTYLELFGTVGVFSGSFWWRAGEEETAVAAGRRIAHEMVRRGERRPGFRAWFQAATRDEFEDRDGDGVIDAIQDTRELIDELAWLGYESGIEVEYVEVKGGRHNYETWSRALPLFLRWAFPR